MMTQTERAAWLAERQTGIGATDLASVLGVGFRTPTEVYAEKCADEPVDREPSPLMRLGLAMEAHNADLYTRCSGMPLISPGLIRARNEPWAFASLDRAHGFYPGVIGRPVELKYTTFFGDDWGPDGTDQVKDGYVVQATWQAAILRTLGAGIDGADISALAGTGEHRIYHIPFDERLAALLFDVGRSFWARVVRRSGVADWEPPFALVDSIADRLAAIRPETTIPLGHEAIELADRYEALKAQKAAAEDEAKAAGGRMKQVAAELTKLLGTHETGVLPDGRRVQQKTVHVAAHQREASSHVRFNILKPRKGKS